MTEVDDPTVAYTGDQPVPEALPILRNCQWLSWAKKHADYERVVALADFLVSLKESPGALTNQEAAHIIALRKNLIKYEQKPNAFHSCHQTKPQSRPVHQLPALTATGTWRL